MSQLNKKQITIISVIVGVIVIALIAVYLYKKNKAAQIGNQPTKPPVSVEPLTIVSAGYGSPQCTFKDVVRILSSKIQNNSISILKGSDTNYMNTLFGGDPCPNVHKVLQVVYSLGNKHYTYNITDQDSILINTP